MKIGRILFLSAMFFTNSMMAQPKLDAKLPVLDVDKQLQYCHKQVNRALAELRLKDGSYDYMMEPRNILKDDKQKGWNCRGMV